MTEQKIHSIAIAIAKRDLIAAVTLGLIAETELAVKAKELVTLDPRYLKAARVRVGDI